MLSLMVLKDGIVVRSAEIAWEDYSCEKIIPGRKPDRIEAGMKYWVIARDRRAPFCRHANRTLDKYGTQKESLYGFFGIVGIAEAHLKDSSLEWCLVEHSTSLEQTG